MFKMSRDYLKQNIIGLTILILIGVLLWPLVPKPNSAVSGIFLPSAPLQASISPDQVQVLDVMPPHATTLGMISTKLYYAALSNSEETRDMNASIAYAKTLAAKAGANAIVVNLMKSGMSTASGPLNGFFIQASAVKI